MKKCPQCQNLFDTEEFEAADRAVSGFLTLDQIERLTVVAREVFGVPFNDQCPKCLVELMAGAV